MNIQKLLILSDFSQVSTALLTYGLTLARQFNAQVWVQHTYYIPPSVAGEVFIPVDALEKYERSIYKEFEALQEKLPALQEKKVQFVVSYGDVVAEMNKLIDQEHIDLVVVGNQGGGFLTNILGSNTTKVIHHAHCPVLAVPEATVFQPFHRIAWATDLKQTKKASLQYVSAFAQAFQAYLDIVHVSEKVVDVRKIATSMDYAVESVRHQFFGVLALDVEKGIEQHIEKYKKDLLVLFPHTHPFFDRLFQKSITRRVAYQANIPLLTVHE